MNVRKNEKFFAFNIWDIDSIKAVMDASVLCDCDVILQTSSRIFAALEQGIIRKFVDVYSEKIGRKAYLHLDHCRDLEIIKKAVENGWDSVMLDASLLPLEENIRQTKQVCSYAHAYGVLVEAEVGKIHGVEEEIVSTNQEIANIHDIKHFLKETDVDLFAAAIGTSHGIYKKSPCIRYDLIEEIHVLTDKPFVVHGGSGLTDDELLNLLSCKNVKKINISSELKQAYRRGILRAKQDDMLKEEGFEVTEVKKRIYTEIRDVAVNKMVLLKGRKSNG